MKTLKWSDYVNTSKVTRFEIIDHRPCVECRGDGLVMVPGEDDIESKQECIGCSGLGMSGRTVVVYDQGVSIDTQIQDDGRTLKVFIDER